MQLKRSRVFVDFQHLSCFIIVIFFNSLLLTPVRAYSIVYNSSVVKNGTNYKEMLVWNDKMQANFNFCLIVVVVIVILYLFYLWSREENNAIKR